MSKEREKGSEILWGLALVGVVGIISNLAFSSRSRDEVIGNAGNRSQISGNPPPKGEALHAMHKNHYKGVVDGIGYDDPERGLAVTLEEHYEYHREHIGRAVEIGLTEEENNRTLSLLWSQVQKYQLRRHEALVAV